MRPVREGEGRSVNDLETHDLREPVAEICARLGLEPSYVSELDISPSDIRVVLYRGKDGRCQGVKYVDELGEVATETLRFRVLT